MDNYRFQNRKADKNYDYLHNEEDENMSEIENKSDQPFIIDFGQEVLMERKGCFWP